MKYMKLIVPLAIVVLMLMIALPAAADDPFGGPPSRTSGNGTTTWAAIYVANTCSAKLTIPGGAASRWFKFDTWKSVDTEVYVDDVPKFGAAYNYFNGQTGSLYNQSNQDSIDNSLRLGPYSNQGGTITTLKAPDNNIGGNGWGAFPGGYQTKEQAQFDMWGDVGAAVDHGFVGRLYDPDYMIRVAFQWPTPNNALLTTRSGTQAFQGSLDNPNARSERISLNTITGDRYAYLRHYDIKMADGQTHLLSGRFHWDGWAYAKIYNLMVWDNDAMFCTKYIKRGDYNFAGTGSFTDAGNETGSK